MPVSGVHALLASIWFAIEGLFLILYVVLDGFDLGVGILSLWSAPEDRAPVLMASLGSVWDANETWLVVLGGTLFGAFPAAYVLLLQALYGPVTCMLLGFVLRGVSFEFRSHARAPAVWEWAFGIGSLVVALSQGLILGGLIQGPILTQAGPFAWSTPFSWTVALGVAAGYTLLGATYLRLHTGAHTRRQLIPATRRLAFVVMATAAVITVATPLVDPWVRSLWFASPGVWYFWAPPVLALGAFGLLLKTLPGPSVWAPFGATLMVFIASFSGLALTLFPYIIPRVLTANAAAADTRTLVFMLAVVGFFIPIMMAYNIYLYRVFRGRVSGSA